MTQLHQKEARSQALFREVNERVEHLTENGSAFTRDSFICECGNPECTQPISLTRAEYERIRGYGNRFAVALDHENPETETIVEQNERFAVVESYAGAASQIARETDPRSQARARAKRNGTAATSESKPVLVFFYSQTSGASRRAEGFLAQVLQRRRNHDTFALRRVECGSRPDITGRFGIERLPALAVVEDKRVRAKIEQPRGCVEIQTMLAPWLN
jgi:Thioredoxin